MRESPTKAQYLSGSKDRRPDTYAGCAELHRRLEVTGHTHGELFDAAFLGELCQQGKMRPRIFFRRRDTHQPLDSETALVTAELHKLHRFLRLDPRLLRLQPG